jgi:mannose-6-phosphate isomerase-like protein (cupin superfamily)
MWKEVVVVRFMISLYVPGGTERNFRQFGRFPGHYLKVPVYEAGWLAGWLDRDI